MERSHEAHAAADRAAAHDTSTPHAARGDAENEGAHSPADHAGHGAPDASWAAAASATLHCLTGCAIGEVLGMVLGTWWGWGTWPTVALAVVLAFFFGYLLTVTSVRRAGLPLAAAVKVALAADTVSITVMEIVDNAVMVVVPGAMHAGLAGWLFWGALAFAFVVAFFVTWPVNKWLLVRGKGHAVVHEYHH